MIYHDKNYATHHRGISVGHVSDDLSLLQGECPKLCDCGFLLYKLADGGYKWIPVLPSKKSQGASENVRENVIWAMLLRTIHEGEAHSVPLPSKYYGFDVVVQSKY